MAETIATRFVERRGNRRNHVQCGIVYCLSRNDCERIAAELEVCMMGSSSKVARIVTWVHIRLHVRLSLH